MFHVQRQIYADFFSPAERQYLCPAHRHAVHEYVIAAQQRSDGMIFMFRVYEIPHQRISLPSHLRREVSDIFNVASAEGFPQALSARGIARLQYVGTRL